MIDLAGNLVALMGVVLCALAGITRIFVGHYIFGFEAATLFVAGIGLMVMGCLAKLHVLGQSIK